MPKNTPNIAVIIINAQVALFSASLPKSRYPRYAITPNVTAINITPIGALLPVNIAAIAMINMNIILTPKRSHIGSRPNCRFESGDLNDLNVLSLGTPFGTLFCTPGTSGLLSELSHIISFGSQITTIDPSELTV